MKTERTTLLWAALLVPTVLSAGIAPPTAELAPVSEASGTTTPSETGKQTSDTPESALGAERTESEEADDAAAAAVAHLGLSVLRQRARETKNGNIVLSPVSLSAALALLSEGAKGDAAVAIGKAMGLPQAPDAALRERIGQIITGLATETPGLRFLSANAAFLATSLEPQPAFIERAQETFGAQVEVIDFAKSDTLKIVNAWFEKGTDGKIPQLLAELPADTRFLLGNALYFKGTWLDRFDATKTADMPFHADGADEPLTLPTMHAERPMAYAETETHQRVQLPFVGERYALTVLLPKAGMTLEQLLAETPPDVLAKALSFVSAQRQSVRLQLPRFDLTEGGEYKASLEAVGLGPIFADDADYSGIAAEALTVGSVVHKATLTVNEDGAEASAATAVLGSRSAAPAKPPVEMTVDRPFVAALVDRTSGAPVMLAVVRDPR